MAKCQKIALTNATVQGSFKNALFDFQNKMYFWRKSDTDMSVWNRLLAGGGGIVGQYCTIVLLLHSLKASKIISIATLL